MTRIAPVIDTDAIPFTDLLGATFDRIMNSTATLVVSGLFVTAIVGYALGANAEHVPCLEDEAYVVAINTNPNHGLAWECVGLEDMLTQAYEDGARSEREEVTLAAEQGYNAALERLMRGERLGPTLNTPFTK